MPPVKSRRVDETEVRRRWAALDREQREAVTRFDDPGLIGCIREAVQSLYQQHAFMARLGAKADTAADVSELSLGSRCLTDVFDLPWKVAKCDHLDGLLLYPEEQQSLMTVRGPALEGDQIFTCVASALPDFLSHKTNRAPLPRARWKQLWTAAPTTVLLLEKMLAQLLEQSLWAMGSNPAYEVNTSATVVVNATEVVLEDWMAEPGKPRAKKKKKKTQTYDAPTTKLPATEQDGAVSELSGAVMQAASDDHAATEAIHDSVLGDVMQAASDAHGTVCTPALQQSELEDCLVLGQDLESLSARSSTTLPDALEMQAHLSAASSVAPEGAASSQEVVGMQVQAQVGAASSRVPEGGTSGRQVLRQHYWRPRASRSLGLQWCLPPNPWSRGYWASAATSTSTAQAVVRNTFIDIDEGSGTEAEVPRAARSLSPQRTTYADFAADVEDYCWLNSNGVNGWYR